MDNSNYRILVRQFLNDHVAQKIGEWDRLNMYPRELHNQAGERGILSLGYANSKKALSDLEKRKTLMDELTLSGFQFLTMGLASHFVSLKVLEICNLSLLNDIAFQVFSGDKLIVLALTEEQAGSDLFGLNAEASLISPTSAKITAKKCYVCNGNRSDYFVTAARIDGQLSLFLVNSNQSGITYEENHFIGWKGLPIATVHMNNVSGVLLGKVGEAPSILRGALAQERLGLTFMANASTKLAIQCAVEYAKQRIIHDELLIKKQSLRHKLADVYARLKLVDEYALSLAKSGVTSREQEVSAAIAKNQSVMLLEETSRLAVQICGAQGCLQGSTVERIYRDGKILGVGGGATEVMNDVISTWLIKEQAQC